MRYSTLFALREGGPPRLPRPRSQSRGGLPGLPPSSPQPPRWGLRRLLQGAAALGLAAIAAALSTSGSTGCGTFCEGGFVRPVPGMSQGTCEGLCSPSQCASADNVCVDNRCELQCASVLDCAPEQDCVPATSDGADGGTVTICQNSTFGPIGAGCPFGTECAMLFACPDGSNCDYTQCSGKTCAPDTGACEGISKCSAGKCPDASPCIVQGCPQSECKALTCLSAGSGDAQAYCTLLDCQTDSNCPAGFWCASERDPHQICNDPKPNPTLCGTTTDACVTTTASGTTFTKGPFCTMRNECREHRQCDPCATDLDCSLTPSQHCTQVGSSKGCTLDCAADSDCSDGFECTGGECVPRFGSCSAPVGAGTFCQTCLSDADCAPGLACARPPDGEERVCALPLGSGNACMTDADCPVSPSTQHGKCMDATVQSSPGDGFYETCWYPYIAATARFDCWCGNKGTGCYSNTDCCSKSCKGGDAGQMIVGTCN